MVRLVATVDVCPQPTSDTAYLNIYVTPKPILPPKVTVPRIGGKAIDTISVKRGQLVSLPSYATDKNGKPAIVKNIPDLRNLDDYVGKEMANRIKDDFANKSGQEHNYSGLDLEVGGEGMKGFYDKILPDFVNKYTKKYGMGTKKANLDPDALRADLTDDELSKGLEKIGMDSKKYYQLPISQRSEIYQQISKDFYPKEKDQVHFVELTDAAKKDIKSKGQPLFSGIGLAAPPLLMGDEEDN
jgi:hypothetical protein